MKLLIKLVLLTIIDFIIIWFWLKENEPDPSSSLGILLLIPFVIFINLIIALVLYFIKRQYTKAFVINSFISAVLMYFLFINAINRHQQKIVESWKFNIKDTVFTINHWKVDNTFSISESTDPGSSTGFLDGKFITRGNEHYLTTDSTKYYIKKGYFYGFRNINDSIKLTKIE